MKLIEYTSENFWDLLDEHLSLRQIETNVKIDEVVKSILDVGAVISKESKVTFSANWTIPLNTVVPPAIILLLKFTSLLNVLIPFTVCVVKVSNAAGVPFTMILLPAATELFSLQS